MKTWSFPKRFKNKIGVYPREDGISIIYTEQEKKLMSEDAPQDIAKKIKECYEMLPDDEVRLGVSEGSDVQVMEFRRMKMHIAADCVFGGLGINRATGQRS